MDSALKSDSRHGSSQRIHIAVVLIEILVVVLLGQLAVKSLLPSMCDDAGLSGPSELLSGCEFLETGGYEAIRIIPGLILIVTGIAYPQRQIVIRHGGFAVALVFLISAIFTNPSDYPWV